VPSEAPGEINRGCKVCGIDKWPFVIGKDENLITQFFLRPREKTKQEVRQTNDQAPQSHDKAYDESDDGLYKAPNFLEGAFDLMRNGGTRSPL